MLGNGASQLRNAARDVTHLTGREANDRQFGSGIGGGQGARLRRVAARGGALQYVISSKTYCFLGVATSCDLRQCDATVMMGV